MNIFNKSTKSASGQNVVFPAKNPIFGTNSNMSGAYSLLAPIEQTEPVTSQQTVNNTPLPEEDYTDYLFSKGDEGGLFQNSVNPAVIDPSAPGQVSMAQTVPLRWNLGAETRLSESLLWPMHEAYYASMGVSAWDGNVPCFVTSSVFIAEAYAEMILNFMQDYFEHLNPAEPIYIVEMASGVGRFGFLLLKELETKLAYFSQLKAFQIRYIMTDFTENNINYWRAHEKFQPFIEKGMLDFAQFRPEEDTSLRLMLSGEILSAQSFHNPLIAISNYFFDSIRQDMFKVSGGTLKEGLVTLEWKIENSESEAPVDPEALPPFSEIQTHYRYQDASSEHYYPQDEFNAILQQYEESVKNGTILFPLGALRVVQNLQTLSNHNMVLLSSDKAYASQEQMLLYNHHQFATHGSFSYMVNYDAIGRYFLNRGGRYFPSANWEASLQTVCCVSTNKPSGPMERMKYYFDRHLNMENTINTVTCIAPQEAQSMGRFLAVVRLSLGDPRVFCEVAKQITDLLPKATLEEKHDLIRLMEICGENFFFFRGERNLPYWMSEIYYELNMQEKSLIWLEKAMAGYSEYMWEYCYMKGRRYERLNDWQNAKQTYEKALSLNPNCEEARFALEQIRCLYDNDFANQLKI